MHCARHRLQSKRSSHVFRFFRLHHQSECCSSWILCSQFAYRHSNFVKLFACFIDSLRIVISVVLGALFIIYQAWKVRNLRDNYLIKKELSYLGILGLFIIAQNLIGVNDKAPFSHPWYSITWWLISFHAATIMLVYPLMNSYGRTFQPYYPWTWITCCACAWRQDGDLKSVASRDDGHENADLLLKVLMDEDLKVTRFNC